MAPMRIALMNPTYWPEVRRGSERLIHDLGGALAERGHDVTVLTSHPRGGGPSREEGIRVIRSRRPPELSRIRSYEYFIATAPVAFARLLGGGYDLAHAFFPVDGWAAVKARRFGGPPVLFSFHGTPLRQYLVARNRRLPMLRATVDAASEVSVLSQASADPYRRYLLRDPLILPGGVRSADFGLEAARNDQPTLFCAASLGDPRKRGELLLRAFERVRQKLPPARLILTDPRDPFLSHLELRLPQGVERVDTDSTSDLARHYGSAWASVLPAIEEAFGLVLIESLAAGTPVIAARSGACPEIVTDPRQGILFEPDDEQALVEAMTAALTAPPGDEIAEACRARAAEFDWEVVVERYLQAYERVLGADSAGASTLPLA
jgi:glycosyltransferase involved in cell wall biosynthesis